MVVDGGNTLLHDAIIHMMVTTPYCKQLCFITIEESTDDKEHDVQERKNWE